MAVETGQKPRVRATAGEERLILAAILSRGTWVSLAVLSLTFLAYIGGVTRSRIPIDDLPRYWGMPASEYLRQAGLPGGWGWIRLLWFGDFLNFVGIAMLAGLVVIAYLALLPAFVRKRDLPYALIVVGEVVVLLLAASGVLAIGR